MFQQKVGSWADGEGPDGGGGNGRSDTSGLDGEVSRGGGQREGGGTSLLLALVI